MFQTIMDGDFDKLERDFILVIFRKTVHWNKWKDKVSAYQMQKALGVSNKTFYAVRERVLAKGFIDIEIAYGGHQGNLNIYGISDELCSYSIKKWIAEKEKFLE